MKIIVSCSPKTKAHMHTQTAGVFRTHIAHCWLIHISHTLFIFRKQSIQMHFGVLEFAGTDSAFFLLLWITTSQCWGQLYLSLVLLTTDLDAVFDYIQQTVTAVRSRRRHTVLIYVNEIYSPFTSAWQTYSTLKTSSSFQWKKRALLEMKMRCVNPAGFPPKWLYVISMHGLGKRRPESPVFNYVTIRGVLWGGWWVMKTRREQWREGGRYSRFPRTILPLLISSSNDAPSETGEEEVINMARTHTYAHVCTHKHTLRYTSTQLASKTMHNLLELSHSLLCCFSISSSWHTHTDSLHIKQLSTC